MDTVQGVKVTKTGVGGQLILLQLDGFRHFGRVSGILEGFQGSISGYDSVPPILAINVKVFNSR